MKVRWTFRIYPTPEQEQHLIRTFGCVRYVWNWALRMRMDAFQAGDRVGYAATDKALTQLKRQPETTWLSEVSCICLQQSLRDLEAAYTSFFAKRSGHPVFKRKGGKQSAKYTGTGFSFDPERRVLKLAKLGEVAVKWSRGEVPKPSSVRVIRSASGKYFVSLVVEVEPIPLPASGKSIGVDFGISRLATLSDGTRVENLRHGAKWQKRLAFYQRRLARCQKGSRRRAKVKRHVARLSEKVANSRRDALHKFSTALVRQHDAIYVEDLNLRGMLKNHSVARALSDVGIGGAIRMLEDKAARYGRSVVRIDRWFPSSKTCSRCGAVVGQLPLSVREWTCGECGATHDRDENAAVNILAAGQAVTAHGGAVRRTQASAGGRKLRRSANQQSARRHA